MKIKKNLVQIENVAFCLLNRLEVRKGRNAGNEKGEKYFLLLVFGMIGDSVLFLDALHGYMDFCKKNNYRLVIGCRKEVISLYKKAGITDAEFIEVNRDKMNIEKGLFKKTVKDLSIHEYEEIVHFRSFTTAEDMLVYCLRGKKKRVFRNTDQCPQDKMKKFFFNNTYDEVLIADPESDQYQRFAKMLRHLGEDEYVSHISTIEASFPKPKNKSAYCVLAPTASSTSKYWPREKYLEIADYLIGKYGLDVVITGGKEGIDLAEYIREGVSDSEKAIAVAGRTSMDEWFGYLQNAAIIVSNDSASVHLGAAFHVPVVCIAPQHDGYRFLPYQPDEVRKEDLLPEPVRCEKMPCFDCRINNRTAGWNNPECRKKTSEGGPYPCVERVKVNDVKKALDRIIYRNDAGK